MFGFHINTGTIHACIMPITICVTCTYGTCSTVHKGLDMITTHVTPVFEVNILSPDFRVLSENASVSTVTERSLMVRLLL